MPKERSRATREGQGQTLRPSRRDYLNRTQLAKTRLGSTPSDVLAWVLNFSHTNLATLRQGEREALGEDLQMLPIVVAPPPGLSFNFWEIPRRPLPEEAVTQIQRDLVSGFSALADGGTWEVPGQKCLKIWRSSRERAALTRFTATWDTSGVEREVILAVVGRLLLDHGEKVRWCPECHRPFVATRRQAYCSTRCSQRVRNQHRKEIELRS